MASRWGVGLPLLAAGGVLAAAALRLASRYRRHRPRLSPRSPVPADVVISQEATAGLTPISELFLSEFDVRPSEILAYGPYKGKLSLAYYERARHKPDGRYVVVVGINPTPLGEGKSTTTIGLSQAIGAHLGKKVVTCIRQPSMGPTFGVKGGAAGGGYAQVVPMEEFNLHMTGDIHAITAANNLFAAAIDARLFHESTASDAVLWNKLCPAGEGGHRTFSRGMEGRLTRIGVPKGAAPEDLTDEQKKAFIRLDIDPSTISWKRVTDTNDRHLRAVDIGLSPTEVNKKTGEQLSRSTGFQITVASEIMAVLALATDLVDLRMRLGRMIACFDKRGNPLTADDFGITGALTVLLMDALMPTTMQTLEGTPALVHCGPFANIAHGNSSVVADRLALKLVGEDGYVLTEAGFGSDMGGEKFFNIKSFYSGLRPSCAVIVCTVRALKLHSCKAPKVEAGSPLPVEYKTENLELIRAGIANLAAHIRNVRTHGVQPVVAINRFATDTDAEIELVAKLALDAGAFAAVPATHFAHGGAGAVELAKAVTAACDIASPARDFRHVYDAKTDSIKSKINAIVTKVYGGDGATYTDVAEEKIARYERDPAISQLPICMSKTQYSLSDDATKLGAPSGFKVTVKDITVSAGAGFLVVSLGAITFIPGLPICPAYYQIDLDMDGATPKVVGLS